MNRCLPRALALASALTLSLLAGCRSVTPPLGQLADAVDAWKAGRHARNAALTPDCDAWISRCHMVFLLKGDSCFRRATEIVVQATGLRALDPESERLPAMRADVRSYYACAAHSFAEAVNRGEDWGSAGGIRFDPDDVRLRLVESLASARDLSTGAAYAVWNTQVLVWAEAFEDTHPNDARAREFLMEARVRQVELDAGLRNDPVAHCAHLVDFHEQLEQAITAPPGPTDRMLDLSTRVEGAILAMPECGLPVGDPPKKPNISGEDVG